LAPPHPPARWRESRRLWSTGTELGFCTVCGSALVEVISEEKPRGKCERCGRIQYRNPSVVAACIVEADGSIVLIRRANEPGFGKWALPAGFVDYDEDVEVTAVRETLEETGLEVELLDLVDAVSYVEPGKNGLVVFYRARPISGTLQAGDDASDAKLFPFRQLPDLAFESHVRALDRWLRRFHDAPAAL
jgi:ADP-ribose pyrophosphatase YjhB (NUDIX family)